MSGRWIPRWKSYEKTVKYLIARKDGKIKSLKTSWERFNSSSIDGLEWGNALLVAARPGIGKSLWKDQFVREVKKLNADQRFRVLEFEWEMALVTSNIRELSSHLGKSYQFMCSAGNPEVEGKMTDVEISRCIDYFRTKVKKVGETWEMGIDTIQEALTVVEFEAQCEAYAATYPDDNILVTVDHVRLAERSGSELDMLYDFGKAIIRMKRKERPKGQMMSFVLLNHLNRNIDKAERCEEGKYGNYIVDSDILGADSLMQAVDMSIGLDLPAQRQIKFYGPSRFIIEDDKVITAQYLKVRNGPKLMCFMRANYEQMVMIETEPPPKSVARIQTTQYKAKL